VLRPVVVAVAGCHVSRSELRAQRTYWGALTDRSAGDEDEGQRRIQAASASRCNRPGSQLNVRVQADFFFVPIQLAEARPLAEQLGNSVHVTVSTICRISFVCTQARIETE
jgi:hypothetical protein